MPGSIFVDSSFVDEITDIIRNMERDYGIQLTSGARQFLIIPVLETYEFTQTFNPAEFRSSLSAILTETRAAIDELAATPANPNLKSSVAVIEAFHKTFCGIPPFCRRRR